MPDNMKTYKLLLTNLSFGISSLKKCLLAVQNAVQEILGFIKVGINTL